MAIVKIKNIKSTPELCIKYVTKNKESVDDNGEIITHETINLSYYSSIRGASSEWKSIRENFDKDNKNLMFHVTQNFGIKIEPYMANEIGYKLAEELFGQHQFIVSTHTDTDYTHNHIVFNAVSFETGKKYNDCNDTYRKIRKVSDRLCKEYRLPVLENTQDYNLVKYADKNGKIRFFEPTERKQRLANKEFKNITDYRNYEEYKILEDNKKTNQDVIREDIKKLLPYTKTYDELLDKLKEIGYEVKSKKVNGDWLKNISFKAPDQYKFTRDYKVGDEYIRANLTAYIESKSKENVNESKGAFIKEIEKLLTDDTKKLNDEVDKIYNESMRDKLDIKTKTFTDKRKQYLLDCINANFKAIHFVKTKKVKSFQQIIDTAEILHHKSGNVKNDLDKIKDILKKKNEDIVAIEKYSKLKKRIEDNKSNSDYKLYEMGSDKVLLETYQFMLKEKNLSNLEKQEKLKATVEKIKVGYQQLLDAFEKIQDKISEYDGSIETISRVDKDGHNKYKVERNEYKEIKEEYTRDDFEREREKER